MDQKMAWWKKILIVLFLCAVGIGVFSMTDTGLQWYIKQVEARPLDPKRKWLMWQVQRMYGWRLDHIKCAEALNKYCWIYGKEDERAAEARFKMAQKYNDAGKLGESIKVYQHVIDYFPRHPLGIRAKEEQKKVLARAQVPSTRIELTPEEKPEHYLLYSEDHQ